ncbi:MAG: hypothetical protein U0S12_01500 [Fimbriimonadales bacterium]
MSAIPFVSPRPVATVTPTRFRPAVRVLSLGRLAAFGLVAGVTFFASSMSGNVMLERARQERRAATKAEAMAKSQAAFLQDDLDRERSLAQISAWAEGHGFVATVFVAEPSSKHGLVALNR